MRKLVSTGRLIFLGIMVLAVLVTFFVTLYKLQIVEGNRNYELSTHSIVSEEDIVAARGNIMDRYGRLLVSNRNCNNLLIDVDELFYSGLDVNDINATILQMCRIITANGDSYNDELPISKTTPWEFEPMSVWQSTLMNAWLRENDLPENATATEVMAMMRTRYEIDGNYTADEMRIIAAVRYAVNVRYVIATADYIFAQDVSINTITSLMEADLPGFEVQVSYLREYNTSYAPHILGYTGAMNDTQYEHYKELGYPMNATVGQAGVEAAFEEYLHGTDGKARITSTQEGIVTSTVYSQIPQPGNNIYLTIDIELQGAAEAALASYIEEANASTEDRNAMYRQRAEFDKIRDLISGGAVAVIDVDTGEPLCLASWPTFDLATFWQDFAALSEDENTPLMNRALQGLYSPGSTFKPCVAVAAMAEEMLSGGEEIFCTGIFDKYRDAGYAPRCTGAHGALTVSDAISYSCNYFFFTVGDRIQIDRIDKYASLLGLGEKTGIELYEEAGHVASPEYKASLWPGQWDGSWFSADTLLTAIGQSVTGITPIQLARYCAALANNGTTYGCSILKSVSSYDYSKSIYEREPEIVSQVEMEPYIWDLIHTGMRGVVTKGTAVTQFYGFPYSVAAKTGTTESNSTTNDAFFICYAPYEDPEIAVAVALENGVFGNRLAAIAQDVLRYYFEFKESTQETERELTLLH